MEGDWVLFGSLMLHDSNRAIWVYEAKALDSDEEDTSKTVMRKIAL